MKVKGTIVSGMSGSLGGITASHNRGGTYLRARAIPTNPNTCRQAKARAAFGGAVQAWNSELTDEQMEEWEAYAANTPVTSSTGDTIMLTGQQAYVKCNSPRINATAVGVCDLPRGDDAPTTYDTGAPPLPPETFNVSSSFVEVAGSLAAPAPVDGHILLSTGIPQKHTRNFYGGPYQLASCIPVMAGETTFEATIPRDEWASEYPLPDPTEPSDERQVPVRVKISYTDLRLSQKSDCLLSPGEVSPS